eukprot:TRINITY_DN8924_c0_g1_i1.p2 TRINITY_DN8924_c0_g1~~TRINITY_DN8924_c0_g1_i1.p2  ORF type:complete len:253 (-),score=52.86 TRINITY_DN8924_c0_g1_i1:498-1256(-)
MAATSAHAACAREEERRAEEQSIAETEATEETRVESGAEGQHKVWRTQSYREQARSIWPGRGQHILAQYDEDSVVVYQAYKREIAEFAVKHQRFAGCAQWGESRMTWIKPNFMWMMFRSGWGGKKNQTNILAIWLKRSAFERYLEHARCKGSVRGFQGTVRLQWDPDHGPSGEKHPYRRAVQLGLKNVHSFGSGEDIVRIEDVSEFVHTQGNIARQKCTDALEVARERVFLPHSAAAAAAVDLSDPPADATE